jgi:hypothetical protein
MTEHQQYTPTRRQRQNRHPYYRSISDDPLCHLQTLLTFLTGFQLRRVLHFMEKGSVKCKRRFFEERSFHLFLKVPSLLTGSILD